MEITVEVLDTMAVLLVVPAVAGSRRLDRARQLLATGPDRAVALLLAVARNFAKLAFALLFIWVLAGVFVVGRILDETLFWIFEAETWADRAQVLGACIAVLASPLILAGLLWVAAWCIRAVLWLPSRIARRHTLSDILAGSALGTFLIARGIAMGIIV